MHLGILIEEALLERLDKSTTKLVDNNNLEKELTATEEYKEAICHMRTHVPISLASQLRSTGGR